jgi:hypothetical protein
MSELSRFWSGLEALPGLAGVRLEWQQVWGDHWEVGQHFLRASREPAATYPCPSPGGDGCPRGVIVHGEQDIVAVCRARPRGCDDLRLAKADIVVWELDWRRLSAAVATALGLTPLSRPDHVLPQTWRIGWHYLVGGQRVAVCLTIQHDPQGFSAALSRLRAALRLPIILASPTAALCRDDSTDLLQRTGICLLALDQCLMWDETAGFTATARVKASLSELAATAAAVSAPSGTRRAASRVLPAELPDGARWGDLRVVVGDLGLSYAIGSRRGERDFIGAGFEDERSHGIPNQAWHLLRQFAKHGGRPLLLAPRYEDRPVAKQRVSKLRGFLRGLFRLVDEPIINVAAGTYAPVFGVRAKDGIALSMRVLPTWSGMSIAESRGGGIRFTADTQKRYMGFTDGHTTEFAEPAERVVPVSEECDLWLLGLVDEDGEPSAAGQALIEVLRSRGRIRRGSNDRALRTLGGLLCGITGIDEPAFRFDHAREEWIAQFEASSERAAR